MEKLSPKECQGYSHCVKGQCEGSRGIFQGQTQGCITEGAQPPRFCSRGLPKKNPKRIVKIAKLRNPGSLRGCYAPRLFWQDTCSPKINQPLACKSFSIESGPRLDGRVLCQQLQTVLDHHQRWYFGTNVLHHHNQLCLWHTTSSPKSSTHEQLFGHIFKGPPFYNHQFTLYIIFVIFNIAKSTLLPSIWLIIQQYCCQYH